MKVQRVKLSERDRTTWMVLGDDFLPVEPIEQFLNYPRDIERSPNAVKAYAFHLKLYWEFLHSRRLEWTAVSIVELADFMTWL